MWVALKSALLCCCGCSHGHGPSRIPKKEKQNGRERGGEISDGFQPSNVPTDSGILKASTGKHSTAQQRQAQKRFVSKAKVLIIPEILESPA